MAAGKYEPESIVLHCMLLSILYLSQKLGSVLAVLAAGFFAQSIDGLVTGGRDNPSRRRGWHARLWPYDQSGGKCLLHGFFGKGKIAKKPSQHCHRPAVLAPKDYGDIRAQPWFSTNGRTSIGVVVARASLPAHARAASRSGS